MVKITNLICFTTIRKKFNFLIKNELGIKQWCKANDILVLFIAVHNLAHANQTFLPPCSSKVG